MKILKLTAMIARLINWRELRIRPAFCPVCGRRRVMVKLDADEMGVRCLSCRASAVTMSVVSVLCSVAPGISGKDVYELSSRGPLYNYLKKNAGKLVSSEYIPDVAPGAYRNGVQCQDVQRLTFPDGSFDVCTSTEVFEHVPDDIRGFSEISRVLRSGGIFIFTVPLRPGHETIERALLTPDGKPEYLLSPEYHEDPFRGSKILVFRDYGRDIIERLLKSGFSRAEIATPENSILWGYSRPVVVAYRGHGAKQPNKADVE